MTKYIKVATESHTYYIKERIFNIENIKIEELLRISDFVIEGDTIIKSLYFAEELLDIHIGW